MGQGTFRTAPLVLFIEKRGWCLPPSSPKRALLDQASRGFLRKLSEAPPFFIIYGKVMEDLRKHIRLVFLLFFVFFLTHHKWNMLILGYGNFTEALEAIFQQNGGGGCSPARPGELGCFLLKQPSLKNVLEGPRFKISIYNPILISSPSHFLCFLAVFLPKPHGTLWIPRRWVSSLPKWSTTVPGWN